MKLTAVLLFFLALPALAHEETLGRLRAFDKTYDAAAPFHTIRVTFSMPKDAAVIRVETDVCKLDVPQDHLLDLPRPDFERLTVPHSATSFDAQAKKWVERGYLTVKIPLHGTATQAWADTFAVLHFDQDGTFKHRTLTRILPTPGRAAHF